MRVLTEGIGSPMWGTQYHFLQKVADRVVTLDVHPYSYGLYIADHGYIVPKYSAPNCFKKIKEILDEEEIQVVFPILHEGLGIWASHKEKLATTGTFVCISPPETISICHDKWETYIFFRDHDIPTPQTSLEHEFELLKPRVGRGGVGIKKVPPGSAHFDMDGYISQKFLYGQEYSVDALCDLHGNVICVVPRKRLTVESGLSVVGKTVRDTEIEDIAYRILQAGRFIGPINMQCFKNSNGIFFTEINPRLAGGTSLSMHATENWFSLIFQMINGKRIKPCSPKDKVIMMRHYTDVIIQEKDLLS